MGNPNHAILLTFTSAEQLANTFTDFYMTQTSNKVIFFKDILRTKVLNTLSRVKLNMFMVIM